MLVGFGGNLVSKASIEQGAVVLKYSLIYRVSLYTIIVYGSCRGAKFAVLVVGFVWRCHRIEWRAASKDFTSTRRYGRLSLEKGLVAPAKKATEKIHSLLQWREALKWLAMYRARSHASLRSSCGSVGFYPVKLQGAADWASTYCHFSYIWHHRLAWAVYVSIYSDVQMFADEIFTDGCWSAKTANIKPREN